RQKAGHHRQRAVQEPSKMDRRDGLIDTDGMVAALPKRHRDVPAWRLLIATKRKGRQNEGHDYRC
ncbi:hypothetical protein, partial [Gemmobacter denitrificans]